MQSRSMTTGVELPAYQGPCCTDACERGDELLSLAEVNAEVELALARAAAWGVIRTAYRIQPDEQLDDDDEQLDVPVRSGRGPLEPLVLHLQFVSVATGTEEDQDSKSY